MYYINTSIFTHRGWVNKFLTLKPLEVTQWWNIMNYVPPSAKCDCSNVWASIADKNVRKLQAVQNFACPIVSGAKKYDHVTTLLKSLSWLPVKDELYYRQAIMAFKCKTGHAPEYLTSQFITREQVSERTTRSSQKLSFWMVNVLKGIVTILRLGCTKVSLTWPIHLLIDSALTSHVP